MRFLNIVRIKDHFYSLPEEKQMELLQASMAYGEKYRKSGKIKDVYFLGDFKGAVSVWEFKSSEEAARATLEDPMLDYWDVNSQSIVEWDIGNKVAMEAFERYAKEQAKKKR